MNSLSVYASAICCWCTEVSILCEESRYKYSAVKPFFTISQRTYCLDLQPFLCYLSNPFIPSPNTKRKKTTPFHHPPPTTKNAPPHPSPHPLGPDPRRPAASRARRRNALPLRRPRNLLLQQQRQLHRARHPRPMPELPVFRQGLHPGQPHRRIHVHAVSRFVVPGVGDYDWAD